MNIDIIKNFIANISTDSLHRYRSWDICNEVFSLNKYSEIHALHLGFYLASWGMYRGSGGLLQKNHRIHQRAVEIVYSKQYSRIKCNESNDIDRNSIPLIMDLKNKLADYYGSIQYIRGRDTKFISCTDTFLSKILLGTMACVPAYDRFFIAGLREENMTHFSFNEYSLRELFDYVDQNRSEINKAQRIIYKATNYHYPVMKVIDMYFWEIGYESEIERTST